jgi:hypothetical protein
MVEGMSYLCAKSCWVIGHVDVELKPNISDISSVVIVRVDVIPCIGNLMEEKSCVFNEISGMGILVSYLR